MSYLKSYDIKIAKCFRDWCKLKLYRDAKNLCRAIYWSKIAMKKWYYEYNGCSTFHWIWKPISDNIKSYTEVQNSLRCHLIVRKEALKNLINGINDKCKSPEMNGMNS